MDNIVKRLEGEALSGKDILTICDNETKLIKYNELYNYKSILDVLHPFGSVVILYEIKPCYGHWVCLIKHKNYIEFFDPYGLFPDDQLEFISEEYRRENNEYYPILTKMLYDTKMDTIYNNIQLQEYVKNVSTCGRHVAFRIVNRKIPLKEYIKLVKAKYVDSDEIVTYFTAFQR